MLKPVVITLVLLLAPGPCPGLLCHAWCDPGEAAEDGCHWPDSGESTRVAALAGCHTLSPADSGFVVESVRAGMASVADCPPDPLSEIVGRLADGRCVVADPSPGSAADRRPLVSALRI